MMTRKDKARESQRHGCTTPQPAPHLSPSGALASSSSLSSPSSSSPSTASYSLDSIPNGCPHGCPQVSTWAVTFSCVDFCMLWDLRRLCEVLRILCDDLTNTKLEFLIQWIDHPLTKPNGALEQASYSPLVSEILKAAIVNTLSCSFWRLSCV